jgi:hypothetical protein
MHRLLGAACVLALLSGCGGATESSDSSQNALSTPSSESTDGAKSGGGERGEQMAACLGGFATCVRNGGDERQCFDVLRACGPRPGDAPRPAEGEPCEDGPRPPGEPPPPPPPPREPDGYGEGYGEGDRPPPPPPGEYYGDAPPPPPCMELLIACAQGTDAIEICVERALGCFAEMGPPPPPPPPPGDDEPLPPPPR